MDLESLGMQAKPLALLPVAVETISDNRNAKALDKRAMDPELMGSSGIPSAVFSTSIFSQWVMAYLPSFGS